MKAIGKHIWAIAEGWIPPDDLSKPAPLVSHETACILNAGDAEAHVEITVFFSDREPAGPYQLMIGARRTKHVRFDRLSDPEAIPRGTDYSSVIVSDQPVVVQHTRLDGRHADIALLTTMAYPVE